MKGIAAHLFTAESDPNLKLLEELPEVSVMSIYGDENIMTNGHYLILV